MQPYQTRFYNPYQRKFYRLWVETPTGTYRLASSWLCLLAFVIDFTIIVFIATGIAEGFYAQPFYIYDPSYLQILWVVGFYVISAWWGATNWSYYAQPSPAPAKMIYRKVPVGRYHSYAADNVDLLVRG